MKTVRSPTRVGRQSKSEIRSTKFETNPNIKIPILKIFRFFVFDFLIWSFAFVSDFEFRISSFGFRI